MTFTVILLLQLSKLLGESCASFDAQGVVITVDKNLTGGTDNLAILFLFQKMQMITIWICLVLLCLESHIMCYHLIWAWSCYRSMFQKNAKTCRGFDKPFQTVLLVKKKYHLASNYRSWNWMCPECRWNGNAGILVICGGLQLGIHHMTRDLIFLRGWVGPKSFIWRIILTLNKFFPSYANQLSNL